MTNNASSFFGEPKILSSSPLGRWNVRSTPWDPHMSHWVNPPEIYDTKLQKSIFKVKDPTWSVEHIKWSGLSSVHMMLRKYPGNHEPPRLEVTIHCRKATARIDHNIISLADLESQMDLLIKFK